MQVVRFELSLLDAARVASLRRVVDARPPVLVLVGAGEDFCGGLDLDALSNVSPTVDPASRMSSGVEELAACLRALDAAPTLVIAAVRGRALGGGLGLAAVADLVIADESARFGLPEALVGLLPAVVFPYVARRVGVARARALALTGSTWNVQEAHRVGLVDERCEDLNRGIERVVKRLARADRGAVASMKALVARHFGASASYTSDAIAAFEARITSAETHARIARFRDGLAPWDTTRDPAEGRDPAGAHAPSEGALPCNEPSSDDASASDGATASDGRSRTSSDDAIASSRSASSRVVSRSPEGA